MAVESIWPVSGVRLVCEAGMVPDNKEAARGSGGRRQADAMTAAKALRGSKGVAPCVEAGAVATSPPATI